LALVLAIRHTQAHNEIMKYTKIKLNAHLFGHLLVQTSSALVSIDVFFFLFALVVFHTYTVS